MNEPSYDAIGRLAKSWYCAEVERVEARLTREHARETHPCTNEAYDRDYDDVKPSPCHLDAGLNFDRDWCEGCKYVQPYWLDYRAKAKKAQRLRYQMTRRIQRKLTTLK